MHVARPDRGDSYDGMEWRQKIRNRRDELRLSQEDLAEMVGVAQTRITKWEKGVGDPSPTHLLRLARALGLSLDYLADDTLDAPPEPAGDLTEADRMILALAKRRTYEVAILALADSPVIRAVPPPPGTPPAGS